MKKSEFSKVQVGDRIRATFDKGNAEESIIVEFTVGSVTRGMFGFELRSSIGMFVLQASGWDVEVLYRGWE